MANNFHFLHSLGFSFSHKSQSISAENWSAVMDPTEHRQMEHEQAFTTKMIKGATVGLVPGILWGTLAAPLELPVENTVVFPGLIPTLKIIGTKGLICAGTGGLWVGVKLLVEKYRMKRDVMNDAAGGLVAGAAFCGLRNKSVFMAINGGVAMANFPILLENIRFIRRDLKSGSK